MNVITVKFLATVSFKNSSYKTGDVVAAEEIPEKILNRLLAQRSVKAVEWVDEVALVAVPPTPPWPLKTSPVDYLKQTPDGPRADLAREILEIA